MGSQEQEFGEVKAKLDMLALAVNSGFAEIRQQVAVDKIDHETRLRVVERWQERLTGVAKLAICVGLPALALYFH